MQSPIQITMHLSNIAKKRLQFHKFHEVLWLCDFKEQLWILNNKSIDITYVLISTIKNGCKNKKKKNELWTALFASNKK